MWFQSVHAVFSASCVLVSTSVSQDVQTTDVAKQRMTGWYMIGAMIVIKYV